MSIDRQYIFNKVVFYLKNETKFFTSSDLQTIIGVDSFNRIAEDLEYPKAHFSGTVTSGQWLVPMPDDFIKIDKTQDIVFTDITQTHTLPPKDQRVIGRDQILTAIPGTPQNYFMEDQFTMGIYPPCTSGIIVVPYVQQPTSLSSDTDTNDLTERCYMAAVYWTVTECMLKDNDERHLVYAQRYEREIRRLRANFNDMFEEDKDMIPADGYINR